ncbi:ABC transporter permease [Leuconostoc citreum]|uniref:ABC transporter permease n=1 Tax=Leuconostoc citreum TaxID=33964 RepID=UPI000660DB38|nr:ABC transporter permease [Leuconostoc citreum]KAF0261293.1 ABC transporter permease [Leuconostoc citreum]MBE4726604.1 ABC transporter permease [Leuconostoc citreum]MCP1275685.1 ABC transporter permease [Leuconostoc citreum]MCT3069213.1 ABC transporter permease [Leuconostoc citreum]MCT3075768.1 ABC transporter permease [Leuconostoc citreum]
MKPKSTWRFILTLTIGLTAVLAIMMTAFSLPAVNSGINNVPIGIIATNDETFQKMAKPLRNKGFKVSEYATAGQAKAQINKRDIYGAISLDASGNLTVYEATAASAAVSQALTQIGNSVVTQQKAIGSAQINQIIAKANDVNTIKVLNQKLAQLNAKTAKIVEVRAFPKADSKGTGLAAGALPIALGGWIGAVAIANMVKGKRQKFAAVISFAVIGGLGLVAVIQYGIGTFDGNYFLTSLGAMLGIAATGFFVLGILEVLGNPGLGIAAVLLILLGNPLSGLASAPEMLPTGWGALGQLLPPGATGTLLRNIAFFNGHAIAYPLTVLLAYVVVGMLLFKIGKKSKV